MKTPPLFYGALFLAGLSLWAEELPPAQGTNNFALINAQRQRELGLDGLSQFDPGIFGQRTTNLPKDVARI